MKHEPAPLVAGPKPSRKRVRILIADDFPEWRKQIRKILASRTEWKIIFETSDGQQALHKALELKPDMVLLDIGMPVMNGIQAARRIRQHCPEAHIIFVTQTKDKDVMEAALAIGAVAYVLKTNAARELVAAIEFAQEIAAAQETAGEPDLAEGAISSGG